MEHYENIGIGPWKPFTELSGTVVEQTSYGEPEDFEFKNRMFDLGPTQLEFVQPIRGTTVNSDFLKNNGEGINHLAFVVDDLEEVTSYYTDKGYKILLTRKRLEGVSTAYIDAREVGGVIFEFIQMTK